ncbi:hypothetical protein LG329_12115 [Virgibacillus necropolis]|uniref:hypothetical protein n=1 Tax=Virgibacillus necropolis TaxID=163877 RepID=UPI00384CCC86
MFKKIFVISLAQIIFIYLFSLEQNVQVGEVIFPFGIVMIIISIMFTLGENGLDVKKEGIRGIGLLFMKDKPTENTGPHKLTLFNSFFLSSCFVMFFGILISL